MVKLMLMDKFCGERSKGEDWKFMIFNDVEINLHFYVKHFIFGLTNQTNRKQIRNTSLHWQKDN